jgi:glucose/arabinose dehydrogenase
VNRTPSIAALLVAAALLASACGSDGEGSTPPPTALTIVPTAPSTPATTTTVARTGTAATTTGAPSTPAPTTAPPPARPNLAAAQLQLVEVTRLEQPIAIALRPGDTTIYVAERVGRIRALRNGAVDPTPVLDIGSQTLAQGERGLLGATFSPDGAFLYVDYTDTNGDSNVDEYVVAADGSVDPATKRQVLFQEQPYANHNGGEVAFGPDGYLYIGFGDGGSAGDPQRRALRLDTWLGKILRIDPRPGDGQPYTVPSDNPFVGQQGAKPEIWAYGLRNPWRFTWDRVTKDLWIADVGQNAMEEIDVAPAAAGSGRGLNFGWSAFEGTIRYNEDQPASGTVGPIATYLHSGEPGGCSITGGYVYRGPSVPALQGAYLFADYCVGGIRALDPAAPSPAAVLTETPRGVISFGEGADGEVYVLTLDGQVLQIAAAA